MNDTYYIQENGQQTGPYTLKELFELELDVDTLVQTPGSQEWQEASYVPELFEYFEAQGIYLPTEGNLASFWVRLLAFFIDYIIFSFVISLLMPEYVAQVAATVQANKMMHYNAKIQEFGLLFLMAFAFYKTLLESTPLRGSIGKRLCRLAVVDADGSRLGVGRAIVRNFTQVIWFFILCIGYLPILWTERRQGWHDMLAKTYVIRRDA